MKEFPILFGPEDAPLMGMVTTPASGDTAPVACLMLNMGAGYRIGPRRINVKLARRLAQHGISSLRMDLSGLGDSSAPKGQERFTQQAAEAARGDDEAMGVDEDFLRALEHAMPPSGGMGMGMDRLLMALTGLGIRETILFPLVK